MHPDLLIALARERQQEFRRHHEFRELEHGAIPDRSRAGPHRFLRTRARIGRILVSVGSRLAEPGPNGLEFSNR